MKLIRISGLIVILLVSSNLFAETMSELDIKSFEDQISTSGTSPLKNPFTPERASVGSLTVEDLYLTGVAIGGGKSYALINGYIFKMGDNVAGLEIKSISTKKVVLQRLDRVHTLYVNGGL